MTQSEVAFLALGLLLGIAAGLALVMVARSRPPTHEIRVTVTRDAVPRRSTTLAADLIHGTSVGPAPGGPGDRRAVDRDDDGRRTTVRPDGLPVVASPALPWRTEPAVAATVAAERGAITIHPEPDRMLSGLGIVPSAATLPSPAVPAEGRNPHAADESDPILPGLLAGDHRAMVRLIDAIGGPDEEGRRAWDVLVTRFVDAVRERSIELGLVDLPMGNPFWDTFTVEQCRKIVVALASTGRRFDGRSDWLDGQVPTYRDLSRALAESGIDPRRVRAWPNSLEIAELFHGAGVAAAEGIADWAPDLDPDDLRRFLGDRDRGLEELWPLWDAVRAAVGVGTQALAPRPA